MYLRVPVAAHLANVLRLVFAAVTLGAAAMCWAQMPQSQQDAAAQLRALPWVTAPTAGNIAGKATVDLTGMRFLDPDGTNRFMTLTGNLPRANSYVLGRTDLGWWAVLDFLPEGLVKDDEEIDAPELMKVLKDGNARAAEERKQRGLPALTLDGWELAPRYDRENKRLEWATLLHDGSGQQVVNYTTKLLGRSGYTTATLVTEPATFSNDVAEFKQTLRHVEYVPGERYSEWKEGDKVAAYGLGALIVGGAAAVATKKGLWAVLGGLLAAGWKLIAGVAVAAVAGLRGLFGRKKNDPV
ncbi:MAG TPA: DUF2167 domain-containing protein [Ramlibacter sp.]|uniref:DUF2167 domain-containing protein n=1 Tax=Ramlibacter sp. TaxID=1917967 RepID=UPI002CCC72EC|nr:DUF2167 domain-containing protein [Ramlibacter sp.]HVZ44049.1 DUF2167 domain-containing protein [Ramlibacter sp.]